MIRPLVTVVIPCFNYARYLPSAIASVRRQRYDSVETIVVDDGSTDRSNEVGRALGVRVIRQDNLGVGAARNRGLSEARGELIVFLDADDELLPDAIATGVSGFAHNASAACLVRCCEAMDAEGRALPTLPPVLETGDLYREWLAGNCFAWTPGAAMFRRERLVAIGGFPAHLGPAADYSVYLTLSREGAVVFDERQVVRYRQHEGNMSRNGSLMLDATLEALRLERPHIRRMVHLEAMETGATSWRAFYGDRMVDHLRASWRARRLSRSDIDQLWTLMRYCPRVVGKHLRRKLARVVQGRRRPEDDSVAVLSRPRDARR